MLSRQLDYESHVQGRNWPGEKYVGIIALEKV